MAIEDLRHSSNRRTNGLHWRQHLLWWAYRVCSPVPRAKLRNGSVVSLYIRQPCRCCGIIRPTWLWNSQYW